MACCYLIYMHPHSEMTYFKNKRWKEVQTNSSMLAQILCVMIPVFPIFPMATKMLMNEADKNSDKADS